MKDWLKAYFTFNRNEQRGLIILLALMLLSFCFSLFSPLLVKKKKFDMSNFQAQVEAFLNDSAYDTKLDYPDLSPTPSHPGAIDIATNIFTDDPFCFDPNDLAEEEWKKTGLNDRLINNILKYRQKGGEFREAEDLRKIYGMTDSLFFILQPYIKINRKNPEKEPVQNFDGYSGQQKADTLRYYVPPMLCIELNAADSANLLLLPGIGPSFASRIIRYRELLGGYVNGSQLLEVRGMDSSRYLGIKDLITINNDSIRKMDLNSITFKEMVRHPYFEYYLVKAIFNYKDQVGKFDSVGQVGQIQNLYPELLERIMPYLEVNHEE